MLIQTTFQPLELYAAVHELVRMAYPKHDLTLEECELADVRMHMEMQLDQQQITLVGWLAQKDKRTVREEKHDIKWAGDARHRQINRLVRRFAYDLLVEHTGKLINSYGILTGMRPVKLVHRMIDQGMETVQISKELRNNFRMSPAKADLMLEVASNNYPYLVRGQQANDMVGLYIGIPFCPTRCYYCSFPGAVISPVLHGSLF